MERNTEAGPSVFCSLVGSEFRERLDWIAALNRTALLDARRAGSHLVLTYRADQADRVREMIRRERYCCGFLGFDLAETREVVKLTITASDGAPKILDEIFEPFTRRAEQAGVCGCASGSACKGETYDSN